MFCSDGCNVNLLKQEVKGEGVKIVRVSDKREEQC